ncbi:hypothetical protein [Streptomyces parvulus]|uniref:hypothetical protein n=1 Tax=Streptomyces parvulus TaxID=146923 RepID=UPI003683E14B
MSEPIQGLETAVRELGALPMPVGPEPRTEVERLAKRVVELQEELHTARFDAARARRECDVIRERVSEPFGCAHCGVVQRVHGRRYLTGAGMHGWERPSEEQVKDRMLARRAARTPVSEAELDSGMEELSAYFRVRLALASAQRGRRKARVRVAELEAAQQQPAEGTYPPALPWARLMDHEDLSDFLDELAASAITHASAETALTEVEGTCGRWRLIAEAQHAHNTAPGPDAEPETGACTECGDGPSKWCVGCAKCSCVAEHDKGCAGGAS